MLSPRGLCALYFSLAIAAGWPNRSFAEQPNAGPTTTQLVTNAPTEPAPPKAPQTPSAPRQPPPTNLAPAQGAITRPGPAHVVPTGPALEKISSAERRLAKFEPATSPAVGSLTPARLFAGPSLHETGRVGKMAIPGARIAKTRSDQGMPQEASIQQALGPAEMPAPPPPGVVNQAVLGREIKSRFAALGSCRTEVSRHKKIAPISGAAHRLILRWTILPSGRIADTTVVAAARVNLRVMDCVKRRMSVWSFSPPHGGAVRIERPLTFASSR